VSRFAEAFGYGTDPAGDAARRERLNSAYLSGHLTNAQWRELGRLSAESARAVSDSISDALGAPDPRVPEEEPYPAPVVAGHELSSQRGLSGTEVTCECGRWDGWYNGARSRRRVLDDWAAHVAAEARAAGPIKVKAERAVKCAVCPFATGCRDGAGPCRAEETGWTPPPRELEP
jgi:hypothetical protein